MAEKFVDIDLFVVVHERTILAHLVFSNNTVEKLLLDKLTICYNNKIRNNLFKVIDKNNSRITYKGIMIKRKVTAEDFIEVNPGDKIETTVALDEVYKVSNGNRYTIQYYAYHPTHMTDTGLTKLESNTVEVVY